MAGPFSRRLAAPEEGRKLGGAMGTGMASEKREKCLVRRTLTRRRVGEGTPRQITDRERQGESEGRRGWKEIGRERVGRMGEGRGQKGGGGAKEDGGEGWKGGGEAGGRGRGRGSKHAENRGSERGREG
eukprot:4784170-Pleurochrysis_carterae.AAC.12